MNLKEKKRYVEMHGTLKHTPEGWMFLATKSCPVQRIVHRSRLEVIETVYDAIISYKR